MEHRTSIVKNTNTRTGQTLYMGKCSCGARGNWGSEQRAREDNITHKYKARKAAEQDSQWAGLHARGSR